MMGRANPQLGLCGFIQFSDCDRRHAVNDSIDCNDGAKL
jgi:hypothetical protein